MIFEAAAVTRIPGPPYIGASTPYFAGPGGNMGEFLAWDAAHGRKVWGIKERFPVWSGSVVTAGGAVVFGPPRGRGQKAGAGRRKPPGEVKSGAGGGRGAHLVPG